MSKVFFAGLTILSSVNLITVTLLQCISVANQEFKVRQQIIKVNSDEPTFYPFNIKTSKCISSCNNINDPYAKMCVPDVVKNLNVKVFNLMSRTHEQDTQNDMMRVSVNVDQMQAFVIIINIGIMINVGLNAKN